MNWENQKPALDDACEMYQLFDMLGKKWMLFILILIGDGSHSFNAISKRLPKMNPKMLSDRLDTLIEKGYIQRKVTQDKPLKISYELTTIGQELSEKIFDIGKWILARK